MNAGSEGRAQPRRSRAPGGRGSPPPGGSSEQPAGAPLLRLLNVGYGNFVATARVVAIVSPASAPLRRLRKDAEDRGKLVDATQGRKTRSILVLDSDHVVLSAVNPDTIAARVGAGEGAGADPGTP